METNTLVTHKKMQSIGIGCVSKILSKHVRVNFGLKEVKLCRQEMLNIVDTSKCFTISIKEYKNRILNNKSDLNYAIVGNELRQYVGIGWVALRVVTIKDLQKYPRVV